MTLFNNSFVKSLLCVSPYHRMLRMLFCIIRATRRGWYRRAYGDMERHRGDCWHRNCWIKSLFLFSSLTKSIPMASYNPDCTSDGRWSILTMTFIPFMDHDTVIYLAVYGTVSSLQVFIQNILNCVPKTNKAFMGLKRHVGKWLHLQIGLPTSVKENKPWFFIEK